MSRQFGLYLLPTDIEALVSELSLSVGIKILQEWAPTLNPVAISSPLQKGSWLTKTSASVHVQCYLSPTFGADMRMQYLPKQSRWSIGAESEVIKFSGCDYDGRTLARGRFYYQNDVLVNGLILPKRQEYLLWAEQVFRTAKKLLHRSKELDAYIGSGAEKWRQNGGKFASLLIPGHEPIYEVDL